MATTSISFEATRSFELEKVFISGYVDLARFRRFSFKSHIDTRLAPLQML